MISVIQGPSAVGKTTLTQSLPRRQVVTEDWDALGFPQASWLDLARAEGQAFGVELCAHRWAVMRRIEEQFGAAYGDTDSLKLYYDFALALYGHKTLAAFHDICERIAEAMREERLGFADRVLFPRHRRRPSQRANSETQPASAAFRPAPPERGREPERGALHAGG